MQQFALFSTTHIYTLIGYFIFFCLLFLFCSFAQKKKKIARIIAILILGLKFSELWYRHTVLGAEIRTLLPLHLCNVTLVVTILAMLFQAKFLFQLVFFWSVGAIFALLTPEVREPFPSFLGISFFITHFYLLFAVAYEMVFFKFRPTKAGLIGSFITLNLIALGVYFINAKLGTNYFYINFKPAFNSPLDFFGPWPNYILVVDGIYLFLSMFMYWLFREKTYKLSIR